MNTCDDAIRKYWKERIRKITKGQLNDKNTKKVGRQNRTKLGT